MDRGRNWLVIVLWIVAAWMIGNAVFGLIFILPKFLALFEELGVQEFPLPMLVLMKTSHFLTSKWWLLALGLIVVWALSRTRVGRKWSEGHGRAKIVVPMVVALLGLVIVPLLMVSVLLPMASVHAQLAAP